MGSHSARAFTRETVHVDGRQFVDCEFKEATLIYGGGGVPVFAGCHFDSCHWQFEGSASRTMAYLRFLHGSGNANLMEDVMREIRGH